MLKFVCREPEDVALAAGIADAHGFAHSAVWIMPEGTDAATLERRSADLADDVVKRGWNLTTRLHIILWGNRRGV